MPTQDLPTAAAKRKRAHEEKAIVRALIRYFETAPPRAKSPAGTEVSSLINAIHRYFVKK
ncbi:MAG TPA: hypothetical protein PLQ15_01780 [Syntrophales bacterium]|nr:hypothetical protein [Syntrophobacterales bacterium]HQL89304.1 hypothetical protein [Syntrophales bacterium]